MVDENKIDEKVRDYLKNKGIEPDMNGYSKHFEKTKETICKKLGVEYISSSNVNLSVIED